MANKFPWFKHYGNASNDAWLRHVVRKAGLGAGWVWWGLCEQLHTHGKGNVLRREMVDLAHYSCTKPRQLTRILDELSRKWESSSRVSWRKVGTIVEVEIKNFRKTQEKYGLKTPSKPPQNPRKPSPREKNRIEKRRDISPRDPREQTSFQKFMDWYLQDSEGLSPGNPDKAKLAAVREGYKRFGRAGKQVLAFAEGDHKLAIKGTQSIGWEMQENNLSWTLDTVAKHFNTWKQNQEGWTLGKS